MVATRARIFSRLVLLQNAFLLYHANRSDALARSRGDWRGRDGYRSARTGAYSLRDAGAGKVTTLSDRRSILFVSNTSQGTRPFLDHSTRYRSFNVASVLASMGHKTAVISQRDFDSAPDVVEQFDYFHFHRPTLTNQNIDFFYNRLKSTAIVADFDDDILRIENAHLSPAVKSNRAPLRKIIHSFAHMAAACDFFDRFTVSTEPLRDEVEKLYSPSLALVVPNALDRAFIGICEMIREHSSDKTRPYKLGYFSGTNSHNGDFASIAPQLADVLARDRSSQMLLVGPVDLPEALDPVASQIVRQQVLPFHRLPYVMALCDVVLGPLENTAFTRAKSGLKFFEAAAVGSTVIATPIPDVARFESPLLYKPETPDEWASALDSALGRHLSPDEREEAARDVVDRVSADRLYAQWVNEVLP